MKKKKSIITLILFALILNTSTSYATNIYLSNYGDGEIELHGEGEIELHGDGEIELHGDREIEYII